LAAKSERGATNDVYTATARREVTLIGVRHQMMLLTLRLPY